MTGHGPPLVKAPQWLTHLEYEAEAKISRHWLDVFSKEYCFLRLDQRGCGLSDREVENISLEAWVSDMEAAVDAAGFERFPLIGASQGGAIAIEYAARHPERVRQLVLYGAFAGGSKRRSTAEFAALLTLIREGWGGDDPAYRQIYASRIMPSASEAEAQSFNQLQRVSTNGENAARIMAAIREIDVRDRLSRVTAPTLVLHRRDDYISEGPALASQIPNARLVILEGRDHWLMARHEAWQTLVSEVRAFLESGTGSDSVVPNGPAHDGLSAREVEVLQLVAIGCSNKEIAEQLVISPSTVAKHIASIFVKTQSTNRTEAAIYAQRNIVPDPATR
jgi:pimeloyl-ACP methyl ester carboxylesterase/DNA-binding CsgD family transcriptional regulator